MDDIKKFFKNDKYAELSGIELLDVKEGYAKAKMPIKDCHRNGLKTVHGGAIFTLADFVFAVASNSRGDIVTSINNSISYLKAGTNGTLYAESEEVAVGGKLSSYIIRVTNDAGELIAVFQGLGYKKNTPVKDTVK